MCVFNAIKFFGWSVGILFSLAIISAGVSLYNKTTPFMDVTNKKLQTQARLYAEAQYSAFDNARLGGSEIFTALRQYSNEPNFFLYVQTNIGGVIRNFALNPMGTSSTCFNFNFTTAQLTTGTMSSSITELQIQDVASSYYVPPQAKFTSKLVRDLNKRVYGIYFQMQ